MQFLADGLVAGATIGLGAVGVTLTYSILRFANFAHGEFISWGCYLTLVVAGAIGAWSSASVAALEAIFSSRPVYLSQELQIAMRIGGLRITPDQLALLGVAVLLVGALQLLLTRSNAGRSMRAVSENPALARIVGIDVAAVIRLTWFIGGALACAAGVMLGLVVQIRPTMGAELLLPLFAAAILGGIGSVPGALLGGLIVGLAEAATVQVIGAEWRAAVAFMILIAVLLLRPAGLFGRPA
jgi:branched-chain amino acid transport system permease protein